MEGKKEREQPYIQIHPSSFYMSWTRKHTN